MLNENVYQEILEAIKDDVATNDDLKAAICRHVSNMLRAITHDIDRAGAREFRNLTICPTRSENRGRNDVPGGFMLIVRAVDRNGDDVVSFHTEAAWETSLVAFCISASSDGIEWKPDDKRGKKVTVGAFFESLSTGGTESNGQARNVDAKRKSV